MKDFIEWCQEKGFVTVSEDGTVSFAEGHTKAKFEAGKKISHKEKMSGDVRDTRDDLSADYKGHMGRNGTVAPYKVGKGKGKGKKVADIAD